MTIDGDTLLYCSVAERAGFLAVFIGFSLRWGSEPYIVRWGLCFFLAAAAFGVALVMRGYPDFAVVTGGVVVCLTGGALAAFWDGARRFHGLSGKPGWVAVLAAGPGVLYFVLMRESGDANFALGAALCGLAAGAGMISHMTASGWWRDRMLPELIVSCIYGTYVVVLGGGGVVLLAHSALAAQLLPGVSGLVDTGWGWNAGLMWDQAGGVVSSVGGLAMVAERTAARLELLTTTDALTGLANRRGLYAEARRMLGIAARKRQPVSVLLIDIDYFKHINDRYGHEAGDAVLAQFAERAKLVAKRGGDLLGRYGGEEFVAVLADTTLAQASALAERVREAMAAHAFAVLDTECRVTVSIGVAQAEPGAIEVDAALNLADRALYAAKDAGRNCVMAFQPVPPPAAVAPPRLVVVK